MEIDLDLSEVGGEKINNRRYEDVKMLKIMMMMMKWMN